jgi:hypothetical protein
MNCLLGSWWVWHLFAEAHPTLFGTGWSLRCMLGWCLWQWLLLLWASDKKGLEDESDRTDNNTSRDDFLQIVFSTDWQGILLYYSALRIQQRGTIHCFGLYSGATNKRPFQRNGVVSIQPKHVSWFILHRPQRCTRTSTSTSTARNQGAFGTGYSTILKASTRLCLSLCYNIINP